MKNLKELSYSSKRLIEEVLDLIGTVIFSIF